MKSYGIIYIHTNIFNTKVYIGQTIQTIERRCRKNDKTYNSYKTCPLFFRALKKYGWGGFETTILAIGSNQIELNQLEDKYLNQYDSCNLDKGYNTATFSEGRGKQSDSTKEKISIKAKLRKGKMGPAKNRNEHKFIDGIEYKHCVGNNKQSHWVPIIEFGQYRRTWDHLHNKCKKCHNLYVHKSKTGNKKLLTPEEFQQSYENRKLALSDGQKRRKLERPDSFKGKIKAIIRIDPNSGDVKEYESGLAVKTDGFDNTYVSQVCNGKRKMFKGYIWRFK